MKNAAYTLMQGGCMLTLDPQLGNFRQADVLLHSPRIAAVSPHLTAPDDSETL